MHEEGEREGNGDGRDTGFIAKMEDYFIYWDSCHLSHEAIHHRTSLSPSPTLAFAFLLCPVSVSFISVNE